MTKPTGKKPQKEQSGKRKKYSHLYSNSTYAYRRSQIETSYINGVKDDDENVVIRPLNQEELDFLDKFYKESVHNTFDSNQDTKKIVREIRSLVGQYSYWKRKKCNKGKINEELEAKIAKKKLEFKKISESLGNLYTDYEDQKTLRSDNYKRRTDVNCHLQLNDNIEVYKEDDSHDEMENWEIVLEDMLNDELD